MSINYLEILEIAKGGDWDRAHTLVQPHSDVTACLIHAYLHRVEGDLGNASYWYRRANSSMPDNTLDEEFVRLKALAEQG